MTDLYLIAHKVRNEPAFDIACKIQCPECLGLGCNECDSSGEWFIIPTSGHRAYPANNWALHELLWSPTNTDPKIPITNAAEAIMAKDMSHLPDHYPTRSTPTISLAEALGLNKPKPVAPIVRRI